MRFVAIDTGFYKSGWLYNGVAITTPRTLHKDIRRITVG